MKRDIPNYTCLALLLYTLTIFGMASSVAASSDLVWQKCLGGSSDDYAYGVQQTSDGGYILAGYTESNNGDVSGNHGYNDYWIVKLDKSGNIGWKKCLGGSSDDYAYSVQQTADGGYVVAGVTYSNNGDVSGNHGYNDYWIVKLDKSGNIGWKKCLGGRFWDEAYSVQQTTDGGYVVAGVTSSNDGDVSGNHGGQDYWIVKLDGFGNLRWQKCLGGHNVDVASSVKQTADGGYIVAGYTYSNDGNVSGNHGLSDCWIVKLDGFGNLRWQKCLGGSREDQAWSIQQISDGGYIVAGHTESNDGDVSGNHGLSDYWIVKLDGSGNIRWQKCLGGSHQDRAKSIQQTSDGGYIVAGYTNSNLTGDVGRNHCFPYEDCWIVKLKNTGNIVWQKCLGGSWPDAGRSVQQTSDGGYIVAGDTLSNDGDVSGNHGGHDYWVLDLGSELEFDTDFMACVIG